MQLTLNFKNMKNSNNNGGALILVIVFVIGFICMAVLPNFQSEESKQAEITKAEKQRAEYQKNSNKGLVYVNGNIVEVK